jgi:hypothetical protein
MAIKWQPGGKKIAAWGEWRMTNICFFFTLVVNMMNKLFYSKA